MPSKIRKAGKIRWKGRVQKEAVIKQKLFETKAAALAWEAEQREANWSKTDTESTLGDWAQRYLDYAQKFSTKAINEKKHTFREFFSARDEKGNYVVSPDLPANRLTPGLVLKILSVQNSNRSGYAANKDRKNLVAAWNWGMKYMAPVLPAPNPCLVERFGEERTPRYIPPEEDYWKVYYQAVGQDQLMLLAFLHLAARRGELFKLTWEDVDFGQGRIRLSTRKRSGGSLEHEWLPMTKELHEKMFWWWENRTFKDRAHVFLCDEETPFCMEYYRQPFRERRHFMKRTCERAGVRPFGFHAIRHLTATILYKMGRKPSEIQVILRHKNPTTTERYLHSLGFEEVRDTLDGLSSRTAGRPENVVSMEKEKAARRHLLQAAQNDGSEQTVSTTVSAQNLKQG